MVFIDLPKAFDTIDNTILIKKFLYFTGETIKWATRHIFQIESLLSM